MSKIMIVDDDPNIRELIRVLLRNGGFDSCEAADGRDALRVITQENPDLAVIDLMMPNMDGYELCRNLRKYYENLPVLMLTADPDILIYSLHKKILYLNKKMLKYLHLSLMICYNYFQ